MRTAQLSARLSVHLLRWRHVQRYVSASVRHRAQPRAARKFSMAVKIDTGLVTMVAKLRFQGSIREVTINRTAGTWFACFCVEDGQDPPPVKDGPTTDVDVGVGTMAVCSDGVIVENPKALPAGLVRLRRLDKAIARSHNVHGTSNHSNRRERRYDKRRNLHAWIVNVRNDHHHKATTAIAKSAGRVVVETLNVAGMIRNRRLARAIADAGMSGFLTKLEYKCAWYGAEYVKADRWFASSKLYSHCGWKHDDLTLSDRELVVRWMRQVERTRLQRCGKFGELAGFEIPGDRTWRPCQSGYAGSGR